MFHSWGNAEKQVLFCESSEKQFLEHIFKKKVRFFGSSSKKKKSSILWVLFNKIFEWFWKKFNSCHEQSSILWLILKNKFKSLSQIFVRVMLKRKVQFLWVMLENKGSVLWVMFFFSTKNRVIQKVQYFDWNFRKINSSNHLFSFSRKFEFFDTFVKKLKVQVFESIVNRRFNSLSYNQKSFCDSCSKKFNSLSHSGKEGSIRWLILKKRVQCFESYSILWVKLKKEDWMLWVILKTIILNSVSRFKKERFNSLNQTQKSSILWKTFFKRFNSWKSFLFFEKVFESYWKNRVQFFESSINSSSHNKKKKENNSLRHTEKKFHSFSRVKKVEFFESHRRMQLFDPFFFKKFNSWIHIFQKRSIYSLSQTFWKRSHFLWPMLKRRVQFLRLLFLKGSIVWILLWRGFNSLSQIFDNTVQFFESYLAQGFNSLSHVEERVQFFESHSTSVQFFEPYSKKCSILWVVFKSVRFCESYQKKSSILWVIFFWKKSFLWVIWRKRLILWVIWRKRFNSLSHLEKEVQFFESYSRKERFKSASHNQEMRSSNLRVILKKRVQFFESYWERGFNSLSHIEKEGSILWVTFKKKFNSFDSYRSKNVQFSESYFLNSILWVILKRGSILWVI